MRYTYPTVIFSQISQFFAEIWQNNRLNLAKKIDQKDKKVTLKMLALNI